MRFLAKEMNDSANRVFKYIKEHERYPDILGMVNDNNKKVVLNKAQYMGLYEAENVYRIKHGRQPNYTTLNSTANNPLVIDYQNNSVNCCPTSLSMCSQMLLHYKSEEQCAKALGTGANGTSPSQLMSNVKSLGFRAVQIRRNYNAVKDSLSKGYPVIMHIETGGRTAPSCLGYRNNYGHYVMCYKVSDNKYYIADPTKGLRICNASTLA